MTSAPHASATRRSASSARDAQDGRQLRAQFDARRLVAVLCFVALFAILTYSHAVLKLLIVEPNFGDFGNYYFNAVKLNEGVNVFALSEEEENRLRRESGLPVLPFGGPGYAPVFQFIMGFLAKLDFWSALGVWLFLNHALLVGLLFAVPALTAKTRSRSSPPCFSCLRRIPSSRTSAWAREDDQGPYFDVSLQGDERSLFNFKFIGPTEDGEFDRFEADFAKFGMGVRSKRFSMIVEDGVVKELNVEAPGEFKVSAAEATVCQL